DFADQTTDRDAMPEFQGMRTKAVYQWPTDVVKWDEYLRLRAEGLRIGRGTSAATDYYSANRAEMDAGAIVAWPERTRGKLSALQDLVDERATIGSAAFAAEYQNDPEKPEDLGVVMLSAE